MTQIKYEVGSKVKFKKDKSFYAGGETIKLIEYCKAGDTGTVIEIAVYQTPDNSTSIRVISVKADTQVYPMVFADNSLIDVSVDDSIELFSL